MAPKQLEFPSVHIVNLLGTPNTKIIKQTVNTAFGGEAVKDKGGIRKCKNGWRKVNFNQVYDRPWLFDDFYRDLKNGSVWIASTYLGDEVYTQTYIAYSTVHIEGYWELRLA